MGYVTAFGTCVACSKVFSFNPHYVPSVRINGRKEPVCHQCIDKANAERALRKEPPFHIHPEAYEPLPEDEL